MGLLQYVLTRKRFCYSSSIKVFVIQGALKAVISTKGCYWVARQELVLMDLRLPVFLLLARKKAPKGVAVGLGVWDESSAFRTADTSPMPGRSMSPLLSKSVFIVFV